MILGTAIDLGCLKILSMVKVTRLQRYSKNCEPDWTNDFRSPLFVVSLDLFFALPLLPAVDVIGDSGSDF